MQTTSQITSSLVEAKGGVVGGQVNLHKFNHTCMYYCYSPKHIIRIRHVYTSYSCSQLNDQTILTTKGFPDNSTCRWPSSNGRPLGVITLKTHRQQTFLTLQVVWSCRFDSGVLITLSILVSKWIHVVINTILVLSPLLSFLFCLGVNQHLRWCVWDVGHSERMDRAAFHMWLSGKWWNFDSYVALPCEKPGFSCIDCWLYISCYYHRFSMDWLLIFTAESGKRSSSDL